MLPTLGRLNLGYLPPLGFDFSGAALPSGATFTRASTAARYNSAGLMVFEASDVARFDYDPVTLRLRGLMLEPARQNVMLQSSAVSTSPWTLAGSSTVTANGLVAPDGSTTGDTVNNLASAEGVNQSATTTIGSSLIQSAFFRAGTATSINHRDAANAKSMVINPVAWTYTPPTTILGAGLAAEGGGWYRDFYAFVSTELANANPRTVGTGSFGLWGVQCEVLGAGERIEASSYIPTTASAATRSADVLTLNWAARGLADATYTIRYVFDDGSTQDVSTVVAGGTAVVPTNLTRRWLRRAYKV